MTQTVLRIDASARRTGSESRALTDQIIARLDADRIITRDLSQALPALDLDWLGANMTPANDRTAEQTRTLALSDDLIAELETADTLVIGTPIYNFSIPSPLKAWIDQIARAGRTFRYTEAGPEGLLKGKRAIVAIASGGTAVGSEIDFASGYLRHILGFVGITDVTFVAADLLMADIDIARAKAKDAISALAA